MLVERIMKKDKRRQKQRRENKYFTIVLLFFVILFITLQSVWNLKEENRFEDGLDEVARYAEETGRNAIMIALFCIIIVVFISL